MAVLGTFGRLAIPGGTFAVAIAIGGQPPASALPAFAEQTQQNCQSCHVGGFGPQLTPFGREFKLGGYTLRAKGFNVPLSAMAVASYVATKKAQEEQLSQDLNAKNLSSVQVVQEATMPLEPVWPRPLLLLAIARRTSLCTSPSERAPRWPELVVSVSPPHSSLVLPDA